MDRMPNDQRVERRNTPGPAIEMSKHGSNRGWLLVRGSVTAVHGHDHPHHAVGEGISKLAVVVVVVWNASCGLMTIPCNANGQFEFARQPKAQPPVASLEAPVQPSLIHSPDERGKKGVSSSRAARSAPQAPIGDVNWSSSAKLCKALQRGVPTRRPHQPHSTRQHSLRPQVRILHLQ
jgi:hypothetical protein